MAKELQDRAAIVEGIAQRRKAELVKDIEAGERSKEALIDSLYELEESEREAEERRQEELDENLITSRSDILDMIAEDEEIGEKILDQPELLDWDAAWLKADELISQGEPHNHYQTYKKAIKYVLDKADAVERDFTGQLKMQNVFWNDDMRRLIAHKRRAEIEEDQEKWKEAKANVSKDPDEAAAQLNELAQKFHPLAGHPVTQQQAHAIYEQKINSGDPREPWEILDESLDIAKRQASIHDMALMRGQKEGPGIGRVVPGPGHMGQSERPQETQRQPSKRGRTKR